MKKRTPQEKKQLSYDKDRRNSYGESPHGARKSIPKRKATRNRANRHYDDQMVRLAVSPLDDDKAELAEAKLKHRAPKTWNKYPDKTLRETVERKLEHRLRTEAAGGRRAVRRKAAKTARKT